MATCDMNTNDKCHGEQENQNFRIEFGSGRVENTHGLEIVFLEVLGEVDLDNIKGELRN